MKNKEPSGEFPGIAGSSPDIPDRVGLEQALRVSEQRYRLAISGSPVVVWECDRDLRYTFMDNPQPPVTDPAQFIGKRDEEILPFDSVRQLIEIKNRVLATGAGERREISLPAADKMFHFEMVVEPIYNSGGTIAGLRGLAIDISERKRTEKALHSVSAELRQTLHIAATGLTHCSRDLRYLSANPAYAQYVGQPLEKIVGRPIVEVIGKAAFEIIRPRIERVLRGESVQYEDEVPIGGVSKCIRVAYTPDRDASGNVVGWVASIIEITERKRAEEALRRSEQRLSEAHRMAKLGSWELNLRNSELWWSEEQCRMYGIPRSNGLLPRERFLQLVHPEDRESSEKRFHEMLALGGGERDFRIVRPDGEVRHIHGTARVIQYENGEPVLVAGTNQDVTESMRAHEELRQLRERFELALRGADLGAWDWNIKTGEVIFNARWGEMRGFRPDEIKPHVDSWISGVHPDDWPVVQKALNEYFDGRTPGHETEFRALTKSGDWIWILGRGKVFERDEHGKPTRMVGTDLDITGRKRLEDELKKAKIAAEEANRAKDLFLAVLSHELRTPLATIQAWAQLLNRGTLAADKVKNGLRVIEESAKAQNQLIEDLLDVSRIVTGKLLVEREPTDLLAVLSSAVESVRPAADKKSIVIEEEIGHDPLIVSADPGRLKQVFLNLLSNSVKFTPSGGKIELTLGTFDDAQGGRVFVRIHDNGKGIAPHFLPRIFDRFSQADASSIRLQGGLGLGLALVKSLLEQQDGSVQAESPGEGKGATFTVLLPRMTS